MTAYGEDEANWLNFANMVKMMKKLTEEFNGRRSNADKNVVKEKIMQLK